MLRRRSRRMSQSRWTWRYGDLPWRQARTAEPSLRPHSTKTLSSSCSLPSRGRSAVQRTTKDTHPPFPTWHSGRLRRASQAVLDRALLARLLARGVAFPEADLRTSHVARYALVRLCRLSGEPRPRGRGLVG